MGAGGRKWQEFLSPSGEPYLEIQAGLARTQLEHLPMPGDTQWSWLEAYGLMEADSDAVHGGDWEGAQGAVGEKLNQLISCSDLEAEYEQGKEWVGDPPVELFQRGSGWGALERVRREVAGELPFSDEGMVFDEESLTERQAPWIGLLREGVMPPADPDVTPRSYMVQDEWQTMLEEAVEDEEGAHWLAWFHLGVMRYYEGERESARRAWERSLQETRTPWAIRNLAVLAQERGQGDEAADLYVAACRMRPQSLPLAVECGRALLEADRPAEWLERLDDLPAWVRERGRIRLLEARAALALDDFERVKHIFAEKPVVNDMREGEVSLSELWFDFHERRLSAAENVPIDDALYARVRREFPVPEEFDFRMGVDDAVSEEGETENQ
jgi:hypothetical protein